MRYRIDSPAMTLDRLLKEPDWTEERLAAAVGVDQSTVNRLRRRQRRAGLGLALRIEAATGGLVRAEDLPMSKEARRDLAQVRERLADAKIADGSGAAA